MDQLSDEIRSVAMQAGADLVGFAPVTRFDAGPAKTHPCYYMPTARSVVVIAIAYPRAISEVWGTYEQEGRLPTPYMLFGFAELNWELSRAALKVAKALEAHGFLGLPIPPSYTLSRYRYWEELDETGRYLGDFSLKHAAAAAGLGTFGWNNIILTPQFGARQRLIAVITEAPLQPGDLYDGEPLCQPERCGFHCVETCPIGALSRDEAQEFEMGGRVFQYAALNHNLCRWCLDGFTHGSGSRTHFEPPDQITQDDLVYADTHRHIADQGLYSMAFVDFCGKCMHQCPSPNF
jgi:epoxyqueuosine reductase